MPSSESTRDIVIALRADFSSFIKRFDAFGFPKLFTDVAALAVRVAAIELIHTDQASLAKRLEERTWQMKLLGVAQLITLIIATISLFKK